MKRFLYHWGLAAILGILSIPSLSSAAIYEGSGKISTNDTVSAMADFSISGDVLTIKLQNTTEDGTLVRGDVLTGIVFDVAAPKPTSLDLSNVALTSGSDVITDLAHPAIADLNLTWTDDLHDMSLADYGLSTSGFSGAFHNPYGHGDDYGIVAAGTFPSPPSQSLVTALPLIQDSLTFTLNIGGALSLSQVENVRFLFGTSGVDVVKAVPEPATVAMWSAFGCIGALLAWRKRRRAA
jgi:hypothetical protein